MIKDSPLPTLSQIESWNDIQENPIVELAPRVVPLPVFVSPSTEGMYNRSISVKVGIPASEEVKKIRQIDSNIKLTESILQTCYSRRSVGRPLLAYIEGLKAQNDGKTPDQFNSAEANTIAKSMLAPLVEIFRNIRANAEQLSNWFSAEFTNKKFWEEAQYSDIYLTHLCVLIHKIYCIENLVLNKSGLIDDVSTLHKYITDRVYSTEINTLRAWLMNTGSNTNMILERISKIDYQQTKTIFDIFYSFIHDHLVNKKYIEADTEYAFISAFIFIVNWYDLAYKKEQSELPKGKNAKKAKPVLPPLPLEVRLFGYDLKQCHKTLILIFEIAPEFTQFFPRDFFNLTKKDLENHQSELEVISEQDLLDDARKTFNSLTELISDLLSQENVKTDNSFVTFLPDAFRKIGEILAYLAEKIEVRRLEPLPPSKKPVTNPGEKPDIAKYHLLQYEYQMKDGLVDILERVLLLLMTCRQTKELVTENIDPILRQMYGYMTEYFQDFVVTKLSPIVKKYKDLEKILQSVRAIIGSFPDDASMKPHKKEFPNLPPPKATPSIQMIELVRVQLQMIINPGSPYTKKKGVFSGALIDHDSIEVLQKFVDDTYFFIDLLRLPEVIESTCDQSRLFFKEHWLDICHVSFFKISTSLPYILSNFALENYHQTELTGAIFYPLSIYDDSAHTALHYLNSRLLYEEIKAEAQICIISITRMIADQSFHPIRSFVALRSLNKTIVKDLERENVTSPISNNSPAVRLGVLLTQNTLFVLGCHIDTKSLIGQRLNELFDEHLHSIIELIRVHGVLITIAASKLIDIARQAHNMMMSFGIPMMEFKDILNHVCCFDTPDSLQSQILLYAANYMTGPLLTDFYIITFPHRLMPKLQPTIQFHNLFRKLDGPAMERVLRPTATVVTTENFRVLFDMLEDGSIALLHANLISHIAPKFSEFVQEYVKLRTTIKRVKDAPLSSSCYQVFDRFYGAYRGFIDLYEVSHLFELMTEIGLFFTISEMMDSAYILKKTGREHISNYVLSRSPVDDKPNDPEMFGLFDREFQSSAQYFDSLNEFSTGREKLPAFLTATVNEFERLIHEHNCFFEESTDITNVQSLNGFGAVWSVLDFIFCMIEVDARMSNETGSISNYGDSVQYVVATILLVTGQSELFDVLSIGNRIQAHIVTDFTPSKDERLRTYIKVNGLVQSSLKCAHSTIQPIFDTQK